jgi:DNA processing protein
MAKATNTTSNTGQQVDPRTLLAGIQWSGDLDRGEGPRIAVIGTRNATAYGEYLAGTIAADLAGRGACVATNLGYGIGAAAGRGALSANGRTLGVVAQALDRPYPIGNTTLYETVRAEGLLVTAYPDHDGPTASQWSTTQRLIAQLVDAVVLVEGRIDGVSSLTVTEARQIGTPVYAVPGPVTSSPSEAPNHLIRTGRARRN